VVERSNQRCGRGPALTLACGDLGGRARDGSASPLAASTRCEERLNPDWRRAG